MLPNHFVVGIVGVSSYHFVRSSAEERNAGTITRTLTQLLRLQVLVRECLIPILFHSNQCGG